MRQALSRQGRGAEIAGLEARLSRESERVAVAEARVTSLLKTSKTARAARPAASASAKPEWIDVDEVARTVADRARQLAKEGKPNEAVAACVACYRQARAVRPGGSACQQLMSMLKYLSRTYAPANTALIELRDSAMAEWSSKTAKPEVVVEIALLNERIGEGSRTLVLYDALPAADIARQSLAMIAFSSFVEAHRYTDALKGPRVGDMIATIDAGVRQWSTHDPSQQDAIRRAIIATTVTNVEVLTGAGMQTEAIALTDKLLAFDSSPATRAALQQHIERARARP